jgi:iron complex outermembrane receptor protein
VNNFQISLLSKPVHEQFNDVSENPDPSWTVMFKRPIYPCTTYILKLSPSLVNNIFNEKYVSNGYYFTFDDDFSNPGTISTVEGAGFTHKQESIL